ncbi:MAG TPA: hypothetical protein VFP68_12360 [Burkholderiaceae bacterium]|nr:hypothetical protein [Burkholderiaceae bacterium]
MLRQAVEIRPSTMPEAGNLLAPNDFSRFAVAAGLGPENNGFLSYDNLYWTGGAPQSASDYRAYHVLRAEVAASTPVILLVAGPWRAGAAQPQAQMLAILSITQKINSVLKRLIEMVLTPDPEGRPSAAV